VREREYYDFSIESLLKDQFKRRIRIIDHPSLCGVLLFPDEDGLDFEAKHF